MATETMTAASPLRGHDGDVEKETVKKEDEEEKKTPEEKEQQQKKEEERERERPPSRQRMHSTVRVNQLTLQFEDATLERAYHAFTHHRKKALWLRSLLPAAAFHILFGLSDCIEHPMEHLLVTIPARVFLAMIQLSMFVLVRWDLVRASESTMLFASICNGLPTLVLFALQRPSLHQWDALFLVFGLSFYTIPKITPLGFVASLSGSWATAAVYAVLALVVRPPPRRIESLLGFLYVALAIGIFNTISYFSEYNSRERFMLRRRLRLESITLAVSRTAHSLLPVNPLRSSSSGAVMMAAGSRGSPATVSGRGGGVTVNRATILSGLALWAALTLGSWTSLPEMLKFVDEDTGWAWFSHCAGLTVFLLIMTRQLQWLLVVPVAGALVLWMMTLALPAYWIIISAHSVGYGMLLATLVVALGVFSKFVCAWSELVAFLTRACFLYPQLQAGLQDEYPHLVKIVSEYTAGMDPEILSARDNTTRAVERAMSEDKNREQAQTQIKTTDKSKTRSPAHDHEAPRMASSAPRRRVISVAAAKTKSTHNSASVPPPEPFSDPFDRGAANDGKLTSPVKEETTKQRMVSVLPSFTPDKCFFCSKNDAEHLVPACGMWGKWTHWRMSQQHDLLYGSLAPALTANNSRGGVPTSRSGSLKFPARALDHTKPVAAAMCTSYYDVQQEKAELEQELAERDLEIKELNARLAQSNRKEDALTTQINHLQREHRAQDAKHTQQHQQLQDAMQRKMDQAVAESNRIAHEHRSQLREAEMLTKKLQRRVRSLGDETERSKKKQAARIEALTSELAAVREELANQTRELTSSKDAHGTQHVEATVPIPAKRSWSEFCDEKYGEVDGVTPAVATTLTTLQPAKRLPYARWLEIEGLRESIGKPDGSAMWSSASPSF